MLLVNNYFTKPAVFNIFVVKYNPVSQSTKLAFCIRLCLTLTGQRPISVNLIWKLLVKASNSYLLKSSLKWTCWFILQICTCTKIRTEWLYEYTYCSSANTTNVLYFNPDFIFLIMFGSMKARFLCCKFALLRQGPCGAIQSWTFAYIGLLNKPYWNEVILTGQNLPLKFCQHLKT